MRSIEIYPQTGDCEVHCIVMTVDEAGRVAAAAAHLSISTSSSVV